MRTIAVALLLCATLVPTVRAEEMSLQSAPTADSRAKFQVTVGALTFVTGLGFVAAGSNFETAEDRKIVTVGALLSGIGAVLMWDGRKKLNARHPTTQVGILVAKATGVVVRRSW